MNSFGGKRKARVIKVSDEGDSAEAAPAVTSADATKDEEPKPIFKSGRKPFRQSGLRKSFNPADGEIIGGSQAGNIDNDKEDDGPAVVRPSVSRSSSLKKKRPNKSSRLSFGGDEPSTAEDESSEVFTPKKVPLGQRVLENSAIKRGIATSRLPVRSLVDEDDRPRYSKEYLEELQSSTPNTPQNISTYPPDDADAMDLDASELEGALVVDAPDIRTSKPDTTILTEVEIREKKERRARLAKEQDFLSLEDDEDDPFGRKKKDDTRLVAEDEDLGEGFDNYVEDGGLSLGKRAEKERRKHERQKMAELITAAEGHTSDSSSDSDADRRIAYEAAQTRAGMDGLKKPKKKPHEDLPQVPPKITPLPNLTECLARLQATLKSMEDDLRGKQSRVEKLKTEREDIVKREGEVQSLLDETGRKYQEAMGHGKVEDGAAPRIGLAAEVVGERGLENLGTPARRDADDEDVL
ncbi:Fc.00g019700.m01.CDS01 [Cosmosporella sp. VM-42]